MVEIQIKTNIKAGVEINQEMKHIQKLISIGGRIMRVKPGNQLL